MTEAHVALLTASTVFFRKSTEINIKRINLDLVDFEEFNLIKLKKSIKFMCDTPWFFLYYSFVILYTYWYDEPYNANYSKVILGIISISVIIRI